jgi:hypothetical protein
MPPLPHEPGPHWGEVGIHGLHRPREWDTVATVQAELAGDVVRFVALPDRAFVVVEGSEDVDPRPLADGLESTIARPYRAEAVRRDGAVWAVGARAIDVVELTEDPGGDVVQLVWNGSERSVLVDGVPTLAGVRELEAFATGRFDAYVAEAQRLDGQLWEAIVTPL